MGAFVQRNWGTLRLHVQHILAKAVGEVAQGALPRLAVEPLEPRTLLTASPVGAEFLANAAAAGEQWQTAMAMNRDGDFVVAWVSHNLPDDTHDIYARRFNAAGEPLGPDLRISSKSINVPRESHADHVALAMDDQDNFVVVWSSITDRASWDDIYARRYDAASNELGSVFRVNKTTAGWQQMPDIAMDPSGNFSVVWESAADWESDADIYAQQFDASAWPVGAEFRVNTCVKSSQTDPAIAMDAAGNFAITWVSDNQDGEWSGIYAQRFNASGQAQGQEIPVNTTTTRGQDSPDIAMAEGGGQFVIVWDGTGPTDESGVYAQRFDAVGLPQGTEFRVNTWTEAPQMMPAVAMDAQGAFAVAWYSRWQDGSGYGVYLQQYDADGVAQGSELRANTHTQEDQARPAIAMDAKGSFVVAWDSICQDSTVASTYAQRFVAPETPASVGGRVWSDENADGIQDPEEVGVDGVEVLLYTQSGLPVARTMTKGGGMYEFAGLVPGQGRYYVQVNPSKDAILALAKASADDANDSDVDSRTGRTSVFAPGQARRLLDAGLVPKARVTGVIFNDANEDGVRNDGEAGLAGRTVFADSNANGQLDDGEPIAVSDADGNYILDDLVPGNQIIRQVPQSWWMPGQPLQVSAARGRTVTGADLVNRGLGSKMELTQARGEFQAYALRQDSRVQDMALAVDAQGGFVMVWTDQGPDGTGWNVYGQRYGADGMPKGNVFLVPSTLGGSEYAADIAMDSQGNFVVVWEDDDLRTSSTVYGRRFDANGTPLGSEFRISLPNTRAESPRVAMDSKGGFLVTFRGENGIQVQRYTAAGIPQGNLVAVSNGSQQWPSLPDIAVDIAGNFAITWIANGDSIDERLAYVRQFNAKGLPLGDAFRVNTFASGQEFDPSIGMDGGGNFVVSWSRREWDPIRSEPLSDDVVYARRFDADGVPLSDAFRPGLGNAQQSQPRVAMTPAGDFVTSWLEGDGKLLAQLYSAAGVAQGEVFELSTDAQGFANMPRVAVNAAGNMVAAWAREAWLPIGQMENSIQARSYKLSKDDAVITGSAGADCYYLTRSGNEIRVYSGTSASDTPLASWPIDQVSSLIINGYTGADTLLVDFSNGDPIPSRGLAFDGGKDKDGLILVGTDETDALTVRPERILLGASRVTPNGIESLTLGGGTEGRILLGSLSIDGPARVRLPAGEAVLSTGELSIRNGGMLDLIEGNLVVRATAQMRDQTLAEMTDLVRSGRSSGGTIWQGSGIASLGAKMSRQTGLVAMLNDNGDGTPMVPAIHGLPLGLNDVVVKYMLNGDVNMDGDIGSDDYTRIDSGYLMGSTGYRNGDLNYDGLIDAADYFLVDSAYIVHGGSSAASQTAASASLSSREQDTATPSNGVVASAKLVRVFATSRVLADAAPAVWEEGSDRSAAGIVVMQRNRLSGQDNSNILMGWPWDRC